MACAAYWGVEFGGAGVDGHQRWPGVGGGLLVLGYESLTPSIDTAGKSSLTVHPVFLGSG